MDSIKELINTVHQLRAPGGCPWDRKQTPQSLRPYLIEEAYEVLDVLDQIDSQEKIKDEKISKDLKEELGDLWLQILLHSEIAREVGVFDIHDVASELREKLVRRHPHVFGDQKVDNANEALQTWEKLKAKEKKDNPKASVLDGLPQSLPALQKTFRTIEKVSRVGFQWEDMEGPLNKVKEEYEELRAEIESKASKEKIEGELGDLLFTICNLGYLLEVEPEIALRKSLDKFKRRFQFVESTLKSDGKDFEDVTLQDMDKIWDQAKQLEKN